MVAIMRLQGMMLALLTVALILNVCQMVAL